MCWYVSQNKLYVYIVNFYTDILSESVFSNLLDTEKFYIEILTLNNPYSNVKEQYGP